ncbi:hypothetical protein Hanom_Chr16g01508231 [Helianthus anomalus]
MRPEPYNSCKPMSPMKPHLFNHAIIRHHGNHLMPPKNITTGIVFSTIKSSEQNVTDKPPPSQTVHHYLLLPSPYIINHQSTVTEATNMGSELNIRHNP